MKLADRVYGNLNGQDPVWILLHPIGTSKDVWAPVLDAATLTHPAIALDLPGHGDSEYLEAFSMEAAAAAVLEYIYGLGRDVIVVGHSIGGMVAQHVAGQQSELVKGLVLVSTLSHPSTEAQNAMHGRADIAREQGMRGLLESTITRWFTPTHISAQLPVIDYVSDQLQHADPKVHAEAWEAIAALDTSDILPNIQMPVLVLVGDEDGTTPPALSEQIASACPHAVLNVLPKVGHALPQEAPRGFVETLNEFVEGLS